MIYLIADFSRIDKKQFDYVIVGSGPAGIHLAEKLKAAGSVLVVERGGIEDQADIGDDSYELDVTGLPYPDFGSRLTTFGGTSNHWGGQSHPMSQATFDTSINGYSWPLDYSEFSKHVPDAAKFLRLKSFTEPNRFEPISPNYQYAKNLERDEFQVSNPILRIGDANTISKYVRDQDVQLLLNTRITQIELTESSGQVKSLVTARGGFIRRIRGKVIILARLVEFDAAVLCHNNMSHQSGTREAKLQNRNADHILQNNRPFDIQRANFPNPTTQANSSLQALFSANPHCIL